MTKPKTTDSGAEPTHAPSPPTSKLDQLLALLSGADGATIEQLAAATGWQMHSVRGAMSGTLKRKGHLIASTKADGVRCYRLVVAA